MIIENSKNFFWKIYYKKSLNNWFKRNFDSPSPEFVKHKVLKRFNLENSTWIETGTYLGTTTNFLSKISPHVYSVEPCQDLYNKALHRFKDTNNVTILKGLSEDVLNELLPTLSGKINFWLDGHYSGGATYKGKPECPIREELKAIDANLTNFDAITILIDDARCFLPESRGIDFPSIDYLVDWAREHQMSWKIEHDIFIIRR